MNFPIALLRGFPEDHKKCLENIIYYSSFKLVFSEETTFVSLEELEKFWGIKGLVANKEIIQTKGGDLFNSFYGSKFVWTGINISMWIEYYTNERQPKDLMVLLAHLALKSIIQKSPWKNVKDKLLLARMAGFDNTSQQESVPDFILHFMKTGSRTRTKLFLELDSFGFKRKSGNTRGLTYSLTLSQSDLEFEVAKSKYLTKQRKLNEKKRKDIKEAEERIKEWIKNRNDN